MKASSLSTAKFNAIATAGQAEVVVEITSLSSDRLIVGNFLEPTDGAYRRTPDTLSATVTSDTPVMMGQKSDVRPGAIIHIRGRRTGSHSMMAERIVILTGHIAVR